MDTNYIIETKNLTKQYGSQKSVADLNIHVKRGRIYGLLGRNGAGKTTTMKMLLGLTKPTSGEVKIWGKSLQGNEKKLLPRIGSLIESPGFYPNLTGTENLRIFATLRGVPNNHAIKDALDLVGLPYKDKKLFSQYSLGMKQRLAIALAVMHDPELLILDEPINGLDPIGIAEVRSFIRELCDARGKTILISSHILSEISLLADDIGIIDHGALLEEESLAELEQKSSKHIRFTLSDTAQAARILERNFHENHFSIQDDHNLRLHNLDLPVGEIVTAFVENGLEVSEVHTCEESLAELEQKSSKHIRFTLSDTAQAARILERNFHENHFSIQDDHNLRLHNLDLPVGKIVTAFVENGLEVSEVHTCEESLEDYFKHVTGGEGIA